MSLLVQNLAGQAGAAVSSIGKAGAGAQQAATAPASNRLADLLHTLADSAVLALATDTVLAELLGGLQPLLRYRAVEHAWAVAGIAGILVPLQLACQASAVSQSASASSGDTLMALPPIPYRSACVAPLWPVMPAWQQPPPASLRA